MSVRTRNLRISKGTTLACAAVALGAIYAQNALSGSRDGSGGSDGAEVVITVDQKPAFLAYVKRHQMHSDLLVNRVSVGQVLPDYGVYITTSHCATAPRFIVASSLGNRS